MRIDADLAKKGSRITNFRDKVNGLADFESSADHGSAVNFGYGLWTLPVLKVELRILS